MKRSKSDDESSDNPSLGEVPPSWSCQFKSDDITNLRAANTALRVMTFTLGKEKDELQEAYNHEKQAHEHTRMLKEEHFQHRTYWRREALKLKGEVSNLQGDLKRALDDNEILEYALVSRSKLFKPGKTQQNAVTSPSSKYS